MTIPSIENFTAIHWLIISAVCFILLFLLFRRRGFKKGSFYPRETLLTKAELYFYYSLKKAVAGRFTICFKVRLADIVNCDWSVWKTVGYKTSGKHIDFVLIDTKTTEIICGIELDDKSHERRDRIERDIFVNSVMENAGVPLLRFPVKRKYLQSELKQAIAGVTS